MNWKKGLLRTGLPLEYVTSGILNNKGHEIFGDYPYIRPNENKELKEFSVDIRTHKCLASNERLFTLSMLIECKYRQPGTSWIFSPYPSSIVPIGLVQSSEDLVPVRLNGSSVYEFEESIGYCISGVELDSNGNGKTDGAKHGAFQLRFAMPVLLKSSFEHVLKYDWYEGRTIELLCPILVTTSEIRVIKPNLALSDFDIAKELDDVTELREAVILNEGTGPQLKEFADSLADEFVKNHPELQNRLSELDTVLVGEEWEKRYSPDIDTIKRIFSSSAERVLIVNYEYLDIIIERLESAIMKDIENEEVYGKIIKFKDGLQIIKN
ncbi:hypothetical protein I2I11_00955 [Pontibacter sp. 172403-2]|uniref:hypothetical protein n=1 Tax=Pontibacter rufus TaxID=2791028 RepID=UPI0018AFB139|nr:hypothetical protein [Pontibacter sp. 172403-2]MBF9251853.1 hypothetical protein [Pontibacter sp. 172403-2]